MAIGIIVIIGLPVGGVVAAVADLCRVSTLAPIPTPDFVPRLAYIADPELRAARPAARPSLPRRVPGLELVLAGYGVWRRVPAAPPALAARAQLACRLRDDWREITQPYVYDLGGVA